MSLTSEARCGASLSRGSARAGSPDRRPSDVSGALGEDGVGGEGREARSAQRDSKSLHSAHGLSAGSHRASHGRLKGPAHTKHAES